MDVNALIEANLRLVPYTIHKYLGGFQNRFDMDDLVGWGNIGLIKAAKKFDVSYGVKFSTYAVPMIHGELQRAIRDDNPVHFTRSVKDNWYLINKDDGIKDKTPEDIAAILEISVPNVLEALAYGNNLLLVSMDEHVNDGVDGGIILRRDVLGSDVDFDSTFNIGDMCAKFSKKELAVFRNRYIEDLSQREVASNVGISQPQVSRVLVKIEAKVREYLKESDGTVIKVVDDHEKAKELLKTTGMPVVDICKASWCLQGTVSNFKKKLRRSGELFQGDSIEIAVAPLQPWYSPEKQFEDLRNKVASKFVPEESVRELTGVPVCSVKYPQPTASIGITLEGCGADYDWLKKVFDQALSKVKTFDVPLMSYSISVKSGPRSE